MKEKLRTIWNFALSVISPTIEQRIEFWVGLNPSQKPLHTQIEPSQRLVNNAMEAIRQNARNVGSVPIVVPQNGSLQTGKHFSSAIVVGVE